MTMDSSDDVIHDTRKLTIHVAEGHEVSALLTRPERPRALLVLAHGAGAGMRHAFMEDVAHRLAGHGIATLRYQFPYMEAGKKRPDRPPLAQATVRAAVARGVELAGEVGREAGEVGQGAPESAGAGSGGPAAAGSPVPVFAGGKSFGGRMTSGAAAEAPLESVAGLVFLGFPLHPAGRPGTDRADHLRDVTVPMLFLQGTRDALADLDLLRPVLTDLANGGAHAELHVIDGADHSFHVLKRSGRTDAEAMEELCAAVAQFTDMLSG